MTLDEDEITKRRDRQKARLRRRAKEWRRLGGGGASHQVCGTALASGDRYERREGGTSARSPAGYFSFPLSLPRRSRGDGLRST